MRICADSLQAVGIVPRTLLGWKVIGYHVAGGTMKDQVCYIATAKAHVNLGFMHGTDLPDPKKLLEGSGKRARHVKLKVGAKIDWPAIRALLRASRELVDGQLEVE